MRGGHGEEFGGGKGGGGSEGGGAGGDGNTEAERRGVDGVGGERGGEGGGGGGEAALREKGAEAVERAADGFLRGVFGGAERGADFAQAFAFEVAEQEGGAVAFGERFHRGVEEGLDTRPVAGAGVHGGDFHRGLLAGLAAQLGAEGVDRGAARDDIQPGGERGIGFQAPGVAGESEEGVLRHFLRERTRAQLA